MAQVPSPPADASSPRADYWVKSRQPLVSLIFIAPLLAVYEVGVVGLGPKAIRNGADIWLRGFLELLDFGQYFLLPVLVVGILLGWHHTTRQAWRTPRGVLSGMCVECAALAGCLWVVSQAEAWILQAAVATLMSLGLPAAVAPGNCGSLAGFIGFFGAGVYEELLFRLMLLPAMAWGIRHLGAPQRSATVLAILASSAVFAAAHYVGRYGEPILVRDFAFWYGLIFRFLAGVFFSVLFVVRGFGIAAGTHAGYDILVRLL
jgi:membrane protease YdiL (CAAX protease family)